MAGANTSSGQVIDLYGGQSAANARRYQGQYAAPMSKAFGWNNSPQFDAQMNERANAGNPFASYLRNTRGLFAPMQADAANAGREIASRAPGVYQSYMNQAQGYLNQIPGFQGQVANAQGTVGRGVNTLNAATTGAQHGSDVSRQMLDESRSPIQAQALYQNALRESLQAANQGAAGRGLLDSGSAQGQADTIARDLAAQSAQSQFGNQQAALQGYGAQQGLLGNLASGYGGLGTAQGQLAGLNADIGRSGIDVGQGMMQALPQYGQQLMAGSQVPFQVAQQLQSFFGASQNPTMALVQALAPQIANESKGWKAL